MKEYLWLWTWPVLLRRCKPNECGLSRIFQWKNCHVLRVLHIKKNPMSISSGDSLNISIMFLFQSLTAWFWTSLSFRFFLPSPFLLIWEPHFSGLKLNCYATVFGIIWLSDSFTTVILQDGCTIAWAYVYFWATHFMRTSMILSCLHVLLFSFKFIYFDDMEQDGS
jgi:hypothetical protein